MKKELSIVLHLLLATGLTESVWAEELTEEEEELLLGIPEPTLPRRPKILAAEGPGEDRSSLSVGMSLLGAIPNFDVRYVKMFGERLGLDVSVATIVVQGRGRISARYLLLDSEDGALAVRVGVMEAHSVAEGALNVGAGPGVVYSLGGEDVRFTASIDVAWPFLSSSGRNTFGGAMQVHPAFGVELPVDDDLELFFEASVLAGLRADIIDVMPILSAGIVW